MREVDQALARAFARRSPTRGETVPPAPHLPGLGNASTTPEAPALEWPPLVLTLERTVGDRFERLADVLVQARERHRTKVLLVTSPHRAEGRTTLILTLARALSKRRGRTLIVDLDLTGPMLARQLGLRPRVGLDDVVANDGSLDDALIECPADRLSVLPLRAPVADPRGFVSSPAWQCVLTRLRREFDTILLDGGPLFAGLGTAVPPTSADAALLVHGRSPAGDRSLQRARQSLEASGIPLLGLAETFTK
ncbi:MAG: CpsD/CapB family tyrosine-protein kinase [Isosphaeraceae bacterium]